ncbi:outer membrane chaperone Skp (OmpH) [Pseudothermotoga thermarum DSM 5069]|uniref:Outer membrane chaperone Skp (OmpH) n=1 Tax=Pseudothermotoga thermarum DSM 5069 TaxID=688269 RepID=F7YWR6_9THEM|nr:outer membrane chaperone Skp (OmpH) [Pseudothermotoga thermarum DSM 5069]
MKKLNLLLTIVLIALLVLLLYGATQSGPRIVFVDVNRITQEYTKMVELNRRYSADVSYYQSKLDEMSKELEEMRNRGASQAELERKQAEILARKQQYEQILQSEYEPKMKQILEEIAQKIDKYAKMMGYDYILNKAALVYGDDAYDITNQLIGFLNAQ